MFFAVELQTSRVYISLHLYGLVKASNPTIRARKIALHVKQIVLWYANALQYRQLGLLHGQPVFIATCSV